jgi:dienelactone hydrolase
MPFWVYLPVYWMANLAGYRVHAYSLAEHYIMEADNRGFLKQLKAVITSVEADVSDFHDQGVEFFATFGNSIGSELALACAKSVPAVSVVVLNTMRGSTSQFLWHSAYGKLWKSMYEAQGYTEATLYNELRPVEACENLNVLGKRRILLYYSKADKTIPPYNTELFVKALAASDVKHKIITNRYLGHFWASVKNHARFWVWLAFLRQAERRLRTQS